MTMMGGRPTDQVYKRRHFEIPSVPYWRPTLYHLLVVLPPGSSTTAAKAVFHLKCSQFPQPTFKVGTGNLSMSHMGNVKSFCEWFTASTSVAQPFLWMRDIFVHKSGCLCEQTLLSFPSDEQQATTSAPIYQPELATCIKTFVIYHQSVGQIWSEWVSSIYLGQFYQ